MAAPPEHAESSTEPITRLPAGRKAAIAEYVATAGQVTVATVAQHFGVSRDTIRRDLDQLDAEGLLIRTHGGAVSLSAHPRVDTGLEVRSRLRARAKEAIGDLAAGLVDDGSVVIANGGTTVLATIRQLRAQRELTVVTNNLRLPAEISPKVFRDLYVFGGSVRVATQTTVGPLKFQVSASGLEHDIQADLALIGVGAVSADCGYSTSNLEEASMMREMMSRARRVAVLADASKCGRQLFARIAGLEAADFFVTDALPAPPLREALARAGVTLLTPQALVDEELAAT